MESAIDSSVGIAAYLALFAGVGFVFVFVNLFIGRFFRPSNPHPEKLEIYECGEPTIGSSFVQFDLRFYVVALVFIIFDVEVAFLFPWATVFGKTANMYHDPSMEIVAVDQTTGEVGFTPEAAAAYRELGVWNPEVTGDAGASELNAMLRDGVPSGVGFRGTNATARVCRAESDNDCRGHRRRDLFRRAPGWVRVRMENRCARLGPRDGSGSAGR